MFKNSVADSVNKLCTALIKKGLSDRALEVANKFTLLNELVDMEFPITTFHLAALLGGDETTLQVREHYRATYYEKHIKPYEAFLNQN